MVSYSWGASDARDRTVSIALAVLEHALQSVPHGVVV